VADGPEYYRQQRDEALRLAKREGGDREGWLRIAAEWQKLLAVHFGDDVVVKDSDRPN
jgi:hypothetical protein